VSKFLNPSFFAFAKLFILGEGEPCYINYSDLFFHHYKLGSSPSGESRDGIFINKYFFIKYYSIF
jgi:hypothetical protein